MNVVQYSYLSPKKNKCLRSFVVVSNGVPRDARVDGPAGGPRHGNLDSPVVERLCEVGRRDITT